MNMRSIILLTLCFLPLHVSAQFPDWRPDLRFELEGTSKMSALAWLGGWSSAIYEATHAGDLSLNVPDCGYLISKEIVEILNSQFEGKTISAEQASAYIWPQLKKRLAESSYTQLHPTADVPAEYGVR